MNLDTATKQEIKREVLRIMSPANKRALMFRRWEHICELVDAKTPLEDIAKLYDLSVSTIHQLHVRGKKERQGWQEFHKRRDGRYVVADASDQICRNCIHWLPWHRKGRFLRSKSTCAIGGFASSPNSYCKLLTIRRPPTCLRPTKTESGPRHGPTVKTR